MKFTSSLMGGSRYFLDPELRAQQVCVCVCARLCKICLVFISPMTDINRGHLASLCNKIADM